MKKRFLTAAAAALCAVSLAACGGSSTATTAAETQTSEAADTTAAEADAAKEETAAEAEETEEGIEPLDAVAVHIHQAGPVAHVEGEGVALFHTDHVALGGLHRLIHHADERLGLAGALVANDQFNHNYSSKSSFI